MFANDYTGAVAPLSAYVYGAELLAVQSKIAIANIDQEIAFPVRKPPEIFFCETFPAQKVLFNRCYEQMRDLLGNYREGVDSHAPLPDNLAPHRLHCSD